LAAQRRVHQDKLNAAIPGRACRGKKKKKPGALTPRPSSVTHTQQGQAAAKAKAEKPKQVVIRPTHHPAIELNLPEKPDSQLNKVIFRDLKDKNPP
jgi:hypothetical protein